MAKGAHNPLRQFPFFSRFSTWTLNKIAGIVAEMIVAKVTPAEKRGGGKCVTHV